MAGRIGRTVKGEIYNLPEGLKLGDPVIANDNDLLGHVDRTGEIMEMAFPDGSMNRVPMIMDGPYARELAHLVDVDPNAEVPIRIGGYTSRRGMTRTEYEAHMNLHPHLGRPKGPRLPKGVTVVAAENKEGVRSLGMEAAAAQVEATGEPALIMEDLDGKQRVVATGKDAIDRRLQRNQMFSAYLNHPLMERYFQHMAQSKRSTGLFRNTEAWHALAEKYMVTLAAARTLGIDAGTAPGSMHFETGLGRQWVTAEQEEAAGWYVTRSLHDSVPYLWMERVDQMAMEPALPPVTITRGLVPHPAMFWSFEAAWGLPEARIDWLLLMETRYGYEVWFPLANDVTRDGKVAINGALIPFGKRYPDEIPEHVKDLTEFVLKRLAFVNSKYVEIPHVRAHRAIRREVERGLKGHHIAMPEAFGAYVVELRAAAPRPARSDSAAEGRDFERKHCWWRRAHTRVIQKKTPKERAVWVQAALCGPPELPLIRKTYVVDR